ncbi:hypothetical protein Tco_1001884 [Tanacetum coccineum]
MPLEPDSFNGIVSMDWFSKYRAVNVRNEKLDRNPLDDETLMIRSNKSDEYASIVASEQRAELCSRIGTLERDNMRLRGMLGVERQRVDLFLSTTKN